MSTLPRIGSMTNVCEEVELQLYNQSEFPLSGHLNGTRNHRVIARMLVTHLSRTIVVPFLVDSGAPVTTMCEAAMKALLAN